MRILNSELMPNILLSDKTSIEYSNTDVTQMSHTGKMGIWGGGGDSHPFYHDISVRAVS